MNKNIFLVTKIFVLLYVTFVFCTTLAAQENQVEFDDAVFMVDEVIQFGEELFLTRLGLDGEKAVILDADNIPDKENLLTIVDNPTAPLGLVLSGGAARAIAHVGVLKKLEEEGIFPDFIVANSMGSMVGLLYAAGVSPDTIEQIITDYPTEFLFTARIPIDGGLIDDYNMISMFYQILGDLDIKNLEIPIVVIAEDLTSRRQVSFMEGDFYKILSATIAMPISFPPVEYKGMKLIDGGTTNLVPVESAAEYTDRILVSTTFSNPENNYTDIISIISRAIDIGKTRQGIKELKSIDSIVIRCDVEDFSYMEFEKVTEIIERGIISTEAVIDKIKASGFDKPTTWNKERVDQFIAKRIEITNRYEKVLASYKRTGMLKQKEFAGYLSVGAEMYSGQKDDYYLDNSDYLYFSQRAEIGTVSGELREYWDPWRGFGLDARLNVSFFDLVSIKNRLMFKWDDFSSGDFVKSFKGILYYGRANFNLTYDGLSGINPFISWEGFFSNDLGLDKGVESAFGRVGIDLYLSNYSFTPYIFTEKYPIVGMGLENDFKIKLIGTFSFGQKTVARFPFNKNDKITLYKNDGLRGAVTEGIFDYLVVTNNNITFEIKTVGSFFESIVVKNLEISAFCDYYRTDINGLSAGLALNVDIALIGLSSVYLSTYGGYDFTQETGFWSLAIGGNR